MVLDFYDPDYLFLDSNRRVSQASLDNEQKGIEEHRKRLEQIERDRHYRWYSQSTIEDLSRS